MVVHVKGIVMMMIALKREPAIQVIAINRKDEMTITDRVATIGIMSVLHRGAMVRMVAHNTGRRHMDLRDTDHKDTDHKDMVRNVTALDMDPKDMAKKIMADNKGAPPADRPMNPMTRMRMIIQI